MNIVLIEDDPDCFVNYEVFLKERQHNVKTYIEADDVVKDIEQIVKSDVVILDLMIQLGTEIKPEEADETGIAIYKRLRVLSSNLRIVVLTARSKADVWRYFSNDKNVRFIAKPISNIDSFYETIERWI
jgi:DNA-binding NtrC family response regulator